MALSSAGIGSGLDVSSIVSQLMAVEQRPLTQLAAKEATYQSRLVGLGSIKNSLTALQTTAKALATGGGVAQFKAVSSDAAALSASSSSTAVAGNYSVAVTQLAQAQKLIAAGQPSTTGAIGAGGATTLTISFGTIVGGTLSAGGIYSNADFTPNGAKVPLTVSIGATDNTLAGIRDAINAADGGVTASIVNDGSGTPYRLAISVDDSGVANSLKIDVSGEAAIGSLLSYDPGEATQNLSQTQVAQNALFTIDGVPITSEDNSVTDAIQGVTLTLSKISSGTPVVPVTVAVTRDVNSLTNMVTSVVNAYNSLNTALAGTTAKGASLQGNPGTLALQRQVRNILGGEQVPGAAMSMLSQIGVTFQKDGSLKLDATVLAGAAASNPAGVSALVAAAGTQLGDAVTNLLGTAGPIQSTTDGINRSIKDIGTRRIGVQRRLDATESRLRAQFSALDLAMSSMNKTSNFLTSQLANLPTTR